MIDRDHWIWDIVYTIPFLIIPITVVFYIKSVPLAIIGIFLSLLNIVIWYAWIGDKIVERGIHFVAQTISNQNISNQEIFEIKINALIKKKNYDEAILRCREWMRFETDSSLPILRLTQLLVDYKLDTLEAVSELETAVARPFPAEDHVALALRLAELYRRTGKEGEVEKVYHRVRNLHIRSSHVQQLK